MTGSTHANHRSARSPGPTPEGPARDNPIAGPRMGTTRSEPSAPASAGASGRHKEPVSQLASACPAQPPRTPQPGVAGYKRCRTQAHTHPDTEARGGGAQPDPKPKHIHPHRTAKPGVAGYKQGAHTNTHKPQHPCQEWRGAAETRARAHTPTPHTPARSGGVQVERAHKHAHPNTPARSGGAQPKPGPKHAHPSEEWRGTSGARAPTRTPQHPSQERRGPPKARASTHAHTAHPSQEWRGTSRARTQAHTEPQQPSQAWRGAVET